MAHQSCVVLRVCRSAVSPGSLCGMCCRAGSRSPPPPAGDSHANSHPCPPWPVQELTWLIPTHTASLSVESQCLGSSEEQERAWFSYFFSSNKPNQRFNAMDVLQNPLSEWFDKVWLSSFSGNCLLCGSCCSTALTNSCSEFSLGMQHHGLSAPGC